MYFDSCNLRITKRWNDRRQEEGVSTGHKDPSVQQAKTEMMNILHCSNLNE